jgi:hypothetical protein
LVFGFPLLILVASFLWAVFCHMTRLFAKEAKPLLHAVSSFFHGQGVNCYVVDVHLVQMVLVFLSFGQLLLPFGLCPLSIFSSEQGSPFYPSCLLGSDCILSLIQCGRSWIGSLVGGFVEFSI